jgi:hypothetical protein
VTYVVQVQREATGYPDERLDDDLAAKRPTWLDVATLKVPPHTKRKTILRQLVAEQPDLFSRDRKTFVRLLDAGAAEVTPIGLEEQPPLPVIG